MTWGAPSPPVQRLSNPIIDDRFEKILAWQVAVNQHLYDLEHHLSQTDSDIAALRACMLKAQQASHLALTQAIDLLHTQIIAMHDRVLQQMVLDKLRFHQDLQTSTRAMREHAWDDWQANLKQRAGERWRQFWKWLNRPLWRSHAR